MKKHFNYISSNGTHVVLASPAFEFALDISDTFRNLVGWWTRMAKEPEICKDMDICEFLDRVETEIEK